MQESKKSRHLGKTENAPQISSVIPAPGAAPFDSITLEYGPDIAWATSDGVKGFWGSRSQAEFLDIATNNKHVTLDTLIVDFGWLYGDSMRGNTRQSMVYRLSKVAAFSFLQACKSLGYSEVHTFGADPRYVEALNCTDAAGQYPISRRSLALLSAPGHARPSIILELGNYTGPTLINYMAASGEEESCLISNRSDAAMGGKVLPAIWLVTAPVKSILTTAVIGGTLRDVTLINTDPAEPRFLSDAFLSSPCDLTAEHSANTGAELDKAFAGFLTKNRELYKVNPAPGQEKAFDDTLTSISVQYSSSAAVPVHQETKAVPPRKSAGAAPRAGLFQTTKSGAPDQQPPQPQPLPNPHK